MRCRRCFGRGCCSCCRCCHWGGVLWRCCFCCWCCLFGFTLLLGLEKLLLVMCIENKWERRCLTSCHPQRGLKLSKNPTSSNRLGNSQSPGGTVKTVTQNRTRRTRAMAKNSPSRPISPTLRYQTPRLSINGQSGNITTAIIIASTPAAIAFCFHCGPSYSQT